LSVAALKETAARYGFDTVRITTPERLPDQGERLFAWLAAQHHGSMQWMSEKTEWRRHPSGLWADAKSIVVLGANYAPDHNPLEKVGHGKPNGVVSVYAQRRDYHDVLKGRLKQIAAQIVRHHKGAQVKVFVDTAPLMEKPLAQAAGLGWQGKHTVLVSREFGSWLFLATILTDALLPPDDPEKDHCGSCTRCLNVCPTNAFPQPYVLDSRRCIAYLTIEYEGSIPQEFRRPIGNRIFGCDDCLAVCPWNKFAAESRDTALALCPELASLSLLELLQLDETVFRALFARTPVKRTGYKRFMRNVLIAAGNSKDPSLLPRIALFLQHEDAILKETATWAREVLS
jgi:epoxyqueuosine reductase